MTNPALVSDDDIALFLLMHKAIRKGLAALARATPTEAHGRWFAFMDRSVRFHHHMEEVGLYPLIVSKDPTFAPELAALEAEHDLLDPLLDRIAAGFTRLPGAAGQVSADLRALEALMRDHLDREEAAVVPRMLRSVTVAELKELEHSEGAKTSFADMAVILPWVLDAAGEREKAMIREVLPWPAKVLYRFSWKPRYDRLVGEVAA